MGLGFALRPSAHQAIAALPTTFRLGIVSRFPEFVNTMLQGIALPLGDAVCSNCLSVYGW